jgi:hypothetical protein
MIKDKIVDESIIEQEKVIEYELDDFTCIRYYVETGKYVAEWISVEEDGEEYEFTLPEKFIEISINKIPFTGEEFNIFQKIVEGELK